MTDFIIVGQGLAANVLAHTFHKAGLSFKIIGDPHLSRSSQVAAGIWNPIVFKRLTKSWLAGQIIPFLNDFYTACEEKLGTKLLSKRNIIRPFSEDQEKQLWLRKAKHELEAFLDDEIFEAEESHHKSCRIEGEYGKVKQAGSIDVDRFLKASADFFAENLLSEKFDYSALTVSSESVEYKHLRARNIIFCEGHLVKNNPWFSWIPLKPVKGELLSFRAPLLELGNNIFNKQAFILSVGDGIFKIGATYDWEDLSEETTHKALQDLEGKLQQMLKCDYEIIKQEAGIRPASVDRRPIIGAHPLHSNLFVFNGLGTKGVMLAPYFANNFVLFLTQKQGLHKEVDVKRFYHLLAHAK
jgi:glycine oxidase